MTLIVALEGSEGLVLAADSRGTLGDACDPGRTTDVQRKLFKLSDYCGLASSGDSECALHMVECLRTRLHDSEVDPQDVDAVLNVSAALMKEEYTSWCGTGPWVAPQPLLDEDIDYEPVFTPQRPPMLFLLAGYSLIEGRRPLSRLYLLMSPLGFAPRLCRAGFMVAGIARHALHLLHRLYKRHMGLESLSALAAYLIMETARRNPKVGGPMQMAEITPTHGWKALDDATVRARVQGEKRRRLRSSSSRRGGILGVLRPMMPFRMFGQLEPSGGLREEMGAAGMILL